MGTEIFQLGDGDVDTSRPRQMRPIEASKDSSRTGRARRGSRWSEDIEMYVSDLTYARGGAFMF